VGFRCMDTIEQRKIQRSNTLKPGLISLTNGSAISCLMRNESSAGACLEVINHFGITEDIILGIPEDIILVIEGEKFERSCRIIWRNHNRLGVIFKRTASADVVPAAKAS
jgi:hypothetical protein